MDKKAFTERYEAYRTAIEDFLGELFLGDTPGCEKLYDSMRYSLLSGGKRLRPVLTLEFARLGGLADWHRALPFACAVEMVHTYSLIHDDLPCMDDDALRRGKPTNHIVFGETMATLAGDALQPEAYRVLLSADLPADRLAKGAEVLAVASGAMGMVAGQVLDLTDETKAENELALLHTLKTGCMFMGAAELGCVAAGSAQELCDAARLYAMNLGMAFQIRDDVLDVTGEEAVFGKPIGSDKAEGKTTYVDLLGLSGCEKRIECCTKGAVEALSGLDGAEFLTELVQTLAKREK